MSATFSTLPAWKKDSTPAEWLQEIAAIALESPEKFGRIVVVYEEKNKDGIPYKTRWQQHSIATNSDVISVLEVAKFEVFEFMKGRRD